jgi:ABC-type sugar transport system substrate-binding protein
MSHSKRRLRAISSIVGSAAVLALGLAGCSNGAGNGDSGDSDVEGISIIYSVDKLDENQNRYIQYMQDHVDALNAEGQNITFETLDANGSVDKQISDVQTALIKEPDVIIFSAVDSVGSLPAVQAAKDAGVKTVDFRPSDPEPPQYDLAFGASEQAYAEQTTTWLQGLLDADPSLHLNIGLIYGAAAQTPQLIREDAVKAFAEEQPDRVTIVGEQFGNWQTDIAQNTTTDWLQAHPEINLVSAANDAMALGAANALTAAGARDRVLVSAYDINEASLENVKNGMIDFTTGVLAPDYGQIIDISVQLVEGTYTDKVYSVEPVYAVTIDTVDDVIAKLNG